MTPAGSAADWAHWGFPDEVAARWHAAGVISPSEATKWTIAQVTPSEVAGWSATGLDATDAVRAFRVGLDLSAIRALPNPRTDVADLFQRRFGDASITVTHSSMPATED
jgi:hypothetical protein